MDGGIYLVNFRILIKNFKDKFYVVKCLGGGLLW